MLIGVDILDQVMLGGRRSSPGADLHAWEMIFRWSVRGHCQADSHPVLWTSRPANCLLPSGEQKKHPRIISSNQQKSSRHCNISSALTREPDGRYVVKLPKCSVSVSLGCSRDQAVRRYKQNERSLVHKGY